MYLLVRFLYSIADQIKLQLLRSGFNVPENTIAPFVTISSTTNNNHNVVLSDEERLKIPLVGNANIADPSQIPVVNENSLNILIRQQGSHTHNNNNNDNPGVSIYPMSEQDKVKDNLTALTGINFDDLIKDVSESVGKVELPIKVEEHHTQVTEEVGKRPYYKYTETIADVIPNADNPRNPQVEIVSKRFQEGDLLSTNPKTSTYRWDPSSSSMGLPHPGITEDGQLIGLNAAPIRNFAPTLTKIAQSAAASDEGSDSNVKVNVTTKTNIVNVFTFNIFVNNRTSNNHDDDDASSIGTNSGSSSYHLKQDKPFKSSIETTAHIHATDQAGQKPTNSFSLFQYDASSSGGTHPNAANQNQDSSSGGGAVAGGNYQQGEDLEKWLKILLNHQAYGDGSNIVAEAVLKDASLHQIPEPRTASMDNLDYRRIEQEQSQLQAGNSGATANTIGPLGYKTDFNGDIILNNNNNNPESRQTIVKDNTQPKTLMETLTGSPIPTILAGLAAISPLGGSQV